MVLGAVLALLLAACGSDDSTASTPGTSPAATAAGTAALTATPAATRAPGAASPAGDGSLAPASPPGATPTATRPSSPATATTAPAPRDAPEVAAAKQDLAAQLGIAVSLVQLVDYQKKVWPDGSYGCPQPGVFYIQAVHNGYLIRLGAGGREYEYHGGDGVNPFLCKK